MRAVQMRAMEGPNVYTYRPVILLRIDLEEFTERESYEFPGLAERLLEECPGLYDHYCAMGRPGGFVERLFGGTYFGHIIEHVSLELLAQIGCKANFGKTRNAGEPGLYDIIVEYESEAATRYVLHCAMEYVAACARGEAFDLKERLQVGRRIDEQTRLGPSTAAIAEAASRRGISVRRLGSGSLLQLGTGRHRQRIQATMTARTSAVAVDIASDKALTKEVLASMGISVPLGEVITTLGELDNFVRHARGPWVIKPLDGSQGRGVTIDIRDWATAERAFAAARDVSAKALVEEFVPGRQYRLLVVGGHMVAASERIPAHVVGDGRRTVRDLVAAVNAEPDRGVDHEKPLTRIPLDESALTCLSRQGWGMYDVPGHGETVYLRDSANLSTGGIACDVTERVHPSFVAVAERCARAIGLDVCGVDLIVSDIAVPAETSGYAVIEVNAAPGIRMHHYPSHGQPQDVAGAIVDSLYPPGSPTRVPIVSVTGTNGKTTTVRMIRHILASTGQCVGLTTTEGVFVGDECCLQGDTTGPHSAQLVLSDPRVDVAVLETARGGIQRGGLAYTAADVGIITNVTGDHLGQDGLKTVDDVLRVKSLVVECVRPDGIAVLNADDRALMGLIGKLKVPVVLVSLQDQNPVVARHLACGGSAYFMRDGWLMEAAGALVWRIAKASELPITLDGAARFHVANALCAIAAARHLGVSRAQAVQALAEFRSDTHNPGRINIFELPQGPRVICDYGHNPDGIRAIGETVHRLIGRRAPAVIGFPGDRNDDVIRLAAVTAAAYFEPLYVKEDEDTRGRARGEVAELIAAAVTEARPETVLVTQYEECAALQRAIDEHAQEPVIVMFHEQLEPVKSVLAELGAREVASFEAPAGHSADAAM
ncbi:MAG: cyanophycin synthetase [Firmicutes bacterium]|nr:cyanophycin synthetase [Bacillota bacterium]